MAFLSREIYGVKICWVRIRPNGKTVEWFEINGHKIDSAMVDMQAFNSLITQPKSWYDEIARRYPK